MTITLRVGLVLLLVCALWQERRIGLADNGDFTRSMEVFTSRPAAAENWPSPDSEAWRERFFSFYIEDWKMDWPLKRPVSSAPLLWLPGALLSAAVGPAGVLSLPIVSLPLRCILVLLLLAAFRWIDRSERRMAALLSVTLGGMLVAVFTAAPYAAYVNSFYQEGVSFILVLLFLASVLLLDAKPTSRLRLGLGIVVVVLLGASKASAIYWPLIGIPVLLCLYAPLRGLRTVGFVSLTVAMVLSAELIGAGVTMAEGASTNRYHSLFYGTLTFSERPADQLEALGGDDRAMDCVGIPAFASGGPECVARNGPILSFANSARVFLREPRVLLRMIGHVTGSMQDISLDYLGRYARSDPRSLSASRVESYEAAETRYRGAMAGGPLDAFDALKFELFPTGTPLILTLLLFAAWFGRNLSSPGLRRGLSLTGLICTVGCAIDMAVAILGDGRYELIKHLAMANLLFDLAAIAFLNTLVIAGWNGGSARTGPSPREGLEACARPSNSA